MNLLLGQFIEKALSGAKYEYDNSVKQWAAWIDGFPGVYAQGKKIEGVRQELVLTLEEYVLVSLREGKQVPGFSFSRKSHAKTA